MIGQKKGKKTTLLMDPKAPKRPLTSYMFFVANNKEEFKDLKIADRGREAGKRWKDLSPEERKVINDSSNLVIKMSDRHIHYL